MDEQINAIIKWRKELEASLDEKIKGNFKVLEDFAGHLQKRNDEAWEFNREHHRTMEKWAETIHAIVKGEE